MQKRLDFSKQICYTAKWIRVPVTRRKTEYEVIFMKKILLTGFEPFGDDVRNPSGEAVQALVASDHYELKKLILPVTWKTAFPKICELWDAWHPDAVLMVGLAGGAKTIRIERVGINLCGAIKDNEGHYVNGSPDIPAEAPVIEGAPDGYFATYNEKAIADALASAEIPAKYSYSAGAYICNTLLFSALDKCKKEGSDMKIGFIHLPYAEGQREDMPTMPMASMVEALHIALDHLWE